VQPQIDDFDIVAILDRATFVVHDKSQEEQKHGELRDR
jgi:hypothetical protein